MTEKIIIHDGSKRDIPETIVMPRYFNTEKDWDNYTKELMKEKDGDRE